MKNGRKEIKILYYFQVLILFQTSWFKYTIISDIILLKLLFSFKFHTNNFLLNFMLEKLEFTLFLYVLQ